MNFIYSISCCNKLDKISTKLIENATLDVYYYSNVAESNIKLYKNVNGSKEEKLLYSVIPSDVQVDLPVFTHIVKASGTKARILIPIKTKTDLGFYDVVVSNKIGQVRRSVEIVPKGNTCFIFIIKHHYVISLQMLN